MGEPDAGNLHVRFDEEGGNPALTLLFYWHGYITAQYLFFHKEAQRGVSSMFFTNANNKKSA
jgi:hypothetical protein